MLLRIVLVAVLAVGVMLAVKSGHIMRGAGLLSTVRTIPIVNGVWGELKGLSARASSTAGAICQIRAPRSAGTGRQGVLALSVHRRHDAVAADRRRSTSRLSPRSPRQEKERRDGLRGPSAAVRLQRSRAAHRRADDADPPRQAPPGVRRQRQQGARRHRMGGQVGRGRAARPRPDPRGQADRRPQQRRRPRQPLAVLGDHGPAAAASPRASSPRRSRAPSAISIL